MKRERMFMQSRVSFRLGAVFGLIVFLTVLASYLSLGHQLQLLLMKSITHELRRELMLVIFQIGRASCRERV